MNTSLKISRIAHVQGSPCLIDVDEYVPLRFRTYEQPIGAAYVRMGNYKTTLLELIIEPMSGAVRGLTVTSFDALSPWPVLAVVRVLDGLPVLQINVEGSRRIDLSHNFSVAIEGGEVLLYWDELGECEAYQCMGKVQFLIRAGRLVGARIIGLSEDQLALFSSHHQQLS